MSRPTRDEFWRDRLRELLARRHRYFRVDRKKYWHTRLLALEAIHRLRGYL